MRSRLPVQRKGPLVSDGTLEVVPTEKKAMLSWHTDFRRYKQEYVYVIGPVAVKIGYGKQG